MEFLQILDKYKLKVDRELDEFFSGKVKEANDNLLRTSYSYLKEFVLRPGKRIRPIATIMAYKATDGRDEKVIYGPSIAPELYHASSLIHDDIMDEDALRRGKETMHVMLENYFRKNFPEKEYGGNIFGSSSKRFSVSLAIMQGNLLYALANESIIRSKLNDRIKTSSLDLCNSAYAHTNEGQMFDIMMSSLHLPTEGCYMDMATRKTAMPIAASIKFGAIMASASDESVRSLGNYGLCIGLAFQIKDDIIDITSDKGREIGADIRKGNKTLIAIKAMEKISGQDKKRLLGALGNEKADGNEVNQAIAIIRKSGSIGYAEKYAEKKITEAKEHLKKAKLNAEGFEFFSKFADYTIKRDK